MRGLGVRRFFFLYKTVCNNLSPRAFHLNILVSAFLEVLGVRRSAGTFCAARCGADWLRPSCLPRLRKRRMCALAVMWVEPHPDALAAAGWCPPSSWWCCAQNLQRGTDAVWRHKRVALRGDIQEKKPCQSRHGYLTDIQFFCVYIFHPVMLLFPCGC